jgi:hypothetical protein
MPSLLLIDQAAAALAQGNSDASVDSLFQDNDAKAKSDASQGSQRASAGKDDTAVDSAKSQDVDEGVKARHGLSRLRPKRGVPTPPLVTLDGFAKSALAQGTGWPGLGPFQPAADGTSLTDQAQNVIKLKTQGQKITGAELQLAGRPGRDFLGTEMSADFLLEALGTRPARINQFNTALEKFRPLIFGKAKNEGHMDAGRYIVYVKPADANSVIVRVENNEAIASDTAGERGSTGAGQSSEPDHKALAEAFRDIHAVPGPSEPTVQPPSVDPGAANNVALTPAEAQKQTFKHVIEKWQSIKRNAVKNRDISQLPEILSGKSLPQQTRGVKWLAEHHYYYDMSPRGIDITSVMEIEKGRRYAVIATVKEYSKMYEETTNKLLKDSEDCYTVNYTVEKQGNKYLIVDSQIIELKPSATVKKL